MTGIDVRHPPTVMVVDDDATVRFLARQFLQKAGFIVRVAENGKDALHQNLHPPPELFMLDVVMPEMDGFTTCVELRKNHGVRNIPILMVTGLDDFDSIRRAYEVGATDFITKPINWLILEYRINYLLRSAEMVEELRRAEEALRKAQEDLEHRVEKRTDELRKANLQLQEEIRQRQQMEEDLRKAYIDLKNTQSQLVQSAKLASIGELAAGIVHELNQPLMVIRGYAQALLRNPVAGPPEQATGLKLIEKNTGRMTSIIDHLRAFSRQSESELQPVQINRIIEDAFLMVGEQLRLRNIEFIKDLTPGLPKVKGDANKLEQVLLNLITNARDAIEHRRENEKTPEAPEKPNLSHPPAKMQIATRLSSTLPGMVEIQLKDTGCGIPQGMTDKIFDPFFTTKEVGKGTGLGLSISYGILKEHHAEIDILETGPTGTTFRILLPIYC